MPRTRHVFGTLLLLSTCPAATLAEGTPASQAPTASATAVTPVPPATAAAATQYTLRYQFRSDETIKYDIEQLVSIDTTIAGTHQKTQLRTQSTRCFKVEAVDKQGNIRFSHTIDRVNMWSEVDGRAPVHFDTAESQPTPPEFKNVADHVGKPISVVTINPAGATLKREDQVQQPDIGLGGLTIPLPDTAIAIGHQWSVPTELKVQLEDKRIHTIKIRELYELTKVETGVATISVKTQVLTPVEDPRIKSQLIQRISQGEIRFDLDAGRLLSRQLDWDEQVLGFSGADSNMKYLQRLTETLVPAQTQTAAVPPAATVQ